MKRRAKLQTRTNLSQSPTLLHRQRSCSEFSCRFEKSKKGGRIQNAPDLLPPPAATVVVPRPTLVPDDPERTRMNQLSVTSNLSSTAKKPEMPLLPPVVSGNSQVAPEPIKVDTQVRSSAQDMQNVLDSGERKRKIYGEWRRGSIGDGEQE